MRRYGQFRNWYPCSGNWYPSSWFCGASVSLNLRACREPSRIRAHRPMEGAAAVTRQAGLCNLGRTRWTPSRRIDLRELGTRGLQPNRVGRPRDRVRAESRSRPRGRSGVAAMAEAGREFLLSWPDVSTKRTSTVSRSKGPFTHSVLRAKHLRLPD